MFIIYKLCRKVYNDFLIHFLATELVKDFLVYAIDCKPFVNAFDQVSLVASGHNFHPDVSFFCVS